MAPRLRQRDAPHVPRVEEYWIVDPDAETVRAWRLLDGGCDLPVDFGRASADTLTTPVMPGLELPPRRDLRRVTRPPQRGGPILYSEAFQSGAACRP